MKLTIIPSDGTVVKNNEAYTGLDLVSCEIPLDVHALQWFEDSGWIEYNDGKTNETITVLPDWANNAEAVWQVAYDKAHAPPPPPPPPTAEQNKITAKDLLSATDWATISDVSDPALSNPYLTNSSEFIAYRNEIRRIAINPVAGNIVWPTKPNTVWSS
jgi:hypothetical protein